MSWDYDRVMREARYLRLWPLAVILLAEALVLAWLSQNPSQAPPVLVTPLSGALAGVILLSGLVPVLLRPGEGSQLTALLAAVFAAFLVTPFSLAEIPALSVSGAVLSTVPVYLLLRMLNATFLGPLFFHLAARFPRRSALSGRLIFTVYSMTFVLLAAVMLVPGGFLRRGLLLALVIWCLVLILLAFWFLLHTGRRPAGVDLATARQARVIFYSLVLAETPLLLRPLFFPLGIELLPYEVALGFQVFVPIGLAFSTLRHDLFGIDRAVRRAFAYTALSVLLLSGYFALTMLFARLFADILPSFPLAAGAVVLLFAAAFFEPLRVRMQAAVDRALYPERLEFRRGINYLRQALAGVVTEAEILRLLTEELPARLGAHWASLSRPPAPETPDQIDPPPVWNARLEVGEKILGRLWLGPRLLGGGYDAEERASLAVLAQQAALSLAYAEAAAALQRLNRELEARVEERTTQIVDQQRSLAAYEARQRIARDLHDSVTQTLFSINLSARALRSLAQQDLNSALAGLTALEQDARNAQAEMRALLNQLRNPGTDTPHPAAPVEPDQRDLVAALAAQRAELARRPGADGHPPFVDVHLEAPAEIILPGALVEEVVLLAREALHNVGKHSGVRQAICRLAIGSAETRALTLEIIDQGCGFNALAEVPAGIGLTSLRARAQAIGGEIEIDTHPGLGTRVWIQIPLEAEEL